MPPTVLASALNYCPGFQPPDGEINVGHLGGIGMVRRLPEVKGRNDYAALDQAAIHYFVGGAVAVGRHPAVTVDQGRKRPCSRRLVDPNGQPVWVLQLLDANLKFIFWVVFGHRSIFYKELDFSDNLLTVLPSMMDEPIQRRVVNLSGKLLGTRKEQR